MQLQLKQFFLIASKTFKEVIQAKILLNTFFIAIAQCVLVFVITKFTFGVPQRVALDVGLGLLTLSSVGIALTLGVSLISNEIAGRTLYIILARAVSRHVFFAGKLVGLLSILTVNLILLGATTLASYVMMGGEINALIMWCIIYIFLEAALLLALTVFFSLITNKALAVFFTLSLWLVGHSLQSVIEAQFTRQIPWLEESLKIYRFVFPNFYKINLKDYVLYNQHLPWEILTSGMFYGLFYTSGVLFFASVIFSRKNFD